MKESIEGIYDKFLEEQKFKQLGVWIPLIIAALIVNGLFGYGIYKQVIQGQRFGNNPMSDTGLIISSIVFSILFLVIFLFFGFVKLKTEIYKEGIRIKFIPFHNTSRLIDWNEIEKLEVVKYDPIGDYGGWGIKSKKGKKAYNVSGDIGLKLYLKNGKNILIGTQCEEELREYLKGKNIIT